MEIALLPIAAVLLLLSGAAAPTHAPGERFSTVALMRHFLAGGLGRAEAAPAFRDLGRARALRGTGGFTRSAAPVTVRAAVGETHATPAGANGLGRKRYRTRFGFADGAYRATAPPLA